MEWRENVSEGMKEQFAFSRISVEITKNAEKKEIKSQFLARSRRDSRHVRD